VGDGEGGERARERAEGEDVEVARFLKLRCGWIGMGFRIGKAIESFRDPYIHLLCELTAGHAFATL